MNEGTRVFDTDDDDPDEAVVVWAPEDTTIADWEYEVDDVTYTTAESNPDYDDDEPLVLVCFSNQLDDHWPEWSEAAPEALLEGVRDHDVPEYGFPESRMAPIEELDEHLDDEDESVEVPEEFEVITERLEENGFEVTLDEAAVELHVEKYGTEYTVDAEGFVEGEAGLRNRVTSIVNRYF